MKKKNNSPALERRYVSDKDLAERFRVSRVSIWRYARDGILPKPIKIGGATRWDLALIEEVEESLADESKVRSGRNDNAR